MLVFAPPPVEAESEPVILIREDSVVDLGGERGVFVLERDTVRFTSVEIGDGRSGRSRARALRRAARNGRASGTYPD